MCYGQQLKQYTKDKIVVDNKDNIFNALQKVFQTVTNIFICKDFTIKKSWASL